MNAGNLDTKLFIQTPVSYSVDLDGQNIPVYATASVWANAKFKSGAERNTTGVYSVGSFYTFTFRRSDFAINEGSILTVNSASYAVRAIQDQEARQSYTVVLAERAP